MRILVTGAAGFLGSHLTEALIEKGHYVTAVDDLSGGYLSNIPNGANFYKADVTNAEVMKAIFQKEKPEIVYHLAAYAAEGMSHFIRGFNYRNNVIGGVNIINECVRQEVNHLVFTSSMAVYGSAQTPFTEDTKPSPEDPYGIAKYAIEQDLRAAQDLFGLEYTIFRPHNVYGPRQNLADPFRNVVGIFINQILKEQPVTIFGDGKQTRAFSYIDDIIPYMVLAPFHYRTSRPIFNVGGEEPITISQLVSLLSRGRCVEVTYLPPRHEVKHAFSDHAKLYSHFGKLHTPTPLVEGLGKMFDWAQENFPQGVDLKSDIKEIELSRGMPNKWIKFLANA